MQTACTVVAEFEASTIAFLLAHRRKGVGVIVCSGVFGVSGCHFANVAIGNVSGVAVEIDALPTHAGAASLQLVIGNASGSIVCCVCV